MTQPYVTCDLLRSIVEAGPDRVAVLVLLCDAPGKPNGEIQFVTWGRTAADKSEAHSLKEWIKNEVFDGEVPEARTHESFILDAAKNKEALDRLRADNAGLLAACKAVAAMRNCEDAADWKDAFGRLTTLCASAVANAEES